MDTLLLSHQGSLGQQLQELISQLVKQQVQEQLQLLQKASPTVVLPAEQQRAGENGSLRKPCEERLKRAIQELTPGLKRRSLPLLIQARMLIKLYEFRENGIAPDLLFSYAQTHKVAGYRYISFFKDRGFLAFIGARQNGKYILTCKGVELIEMLQ